MVDTSIVDVQQGNLHSRCWYMLGRFVLRMQAELMHESVA